MAETNEEFELKYENGNFCELTYKKNGGAKILIVKMEENGAIGSLMSEYTKICTNFFESRINEMAKVMKEK